VIRCILCRGVDRSLFVADHRNTHILAVTNERCPQRTVANFSFRLHGGSLVSAENTMEIIDQTFNRAKVSMVVDLGLGLGLYAGFSGTEVAH